MTKDPNTCITVVVLFAGINKNSQGVVDIKLDLVHTNLVMVNILKPGLTAAQFCERLEKVRIPVSGRHSHFVPTAQINVTKSIE